MSWRNIEQILHVSDSFHHNERRDAILVKGPEGHFAALLQFIFIYQPPESDEQYATALIQALDAPIGPIRRKDRALEMIRLREVSRKRCEFIPVESIVRGILAVPAFDKEGDYMMLDVLDSDIRMRVHLKTDALPIPPPHRDL